MGDATPKQNWLLVPGTEFVLGSGATWLIEGILPNGAFAVLYGQKGSFKSFVAMGMVQAVISGKAFCDFPITKQGAVLYFFLEGKMGAKKRVRGMFLSLAPDEQARFQTFSHALRMPKTSAKTWLTLVENVKQWQQKLGKDTPLLVVIDTFARFSEVDENSSTEVGQVIDALQDLIDSTGATILVVHHEGRRQGNMRGSSALDGATDTIIYVEKNNLAAKLSCEKQKDFDEFDPFMVKLASVDLPDGENTLVVAGRGGSPAAEALGKAADSVVDGRKQVSAAKNAILEALKGSAGMGHNELEELVRNSTGVSEGTFATARKELQNDNKIQSPRRGVWLLVAGEVQ